MSDVFGFDAYSPSDIAERVAAVGVTKARLPRVTMTMLGILAGGFIGFGALYFTLITSDPALSFATGRVLGGLSFCLGLILVVAAGAELFTGNNLLVMAWAEGKLTTVEVLSNWITICLANLIGAAGLATLVLASGHLDMNGGSVGRQALTIAAAKLSTPLPEVFFRAILCNILVCLAVWMSMAGRSIIDKAVAIVFPISAFVAAGFEHSVANMYFLPLALMKQGIAPVPGIELGNSAITSAVIHTLVVIAGNLIGGALLVAVVYHLIYRRGAAAALRPTGK